MVSLKIEEQKPFTAGLFLGELFDAFLVREVQIVTFNTFSIDGRIRRGYYSAEEAEERRLEEYSYWKTLKPYCYSLIKGKHLPESFRVVLMLSEDAKEKMLKKHLPQTPPETVGGLYLNIQYENNELRVVTGTSMKTFTMDKSVEWEWDACVKEFLKKQGIALGE